MHLSSAFIFHSTTYVEYHLSANSSFSRVHKTQPISDHNLAPFSSSLFCSMSNLGGLKCSSHPQPNCTHRPAAHLVPDSHCAVVLSGRGQKRRGWGTVRGHILFWGWLWDCYYHFQSIKAIPLAFSHSLSPSKLKEMKVCLCSIPCYITSMH